MHKIPTDSTHVGRVIQTVPLRILSQVSATCEREPHRIRGREFTCPAPTRRLWSARKPDRHPSRLTNLLDLTILSVSKYILRVRLQRQTVQASDAYAVEAEFYKALAHPVRLRILEILAVEESCVCHLTAVLKQRQPYVSQQLMTLRSAHLVTGRRDGVIVYYRLAATETAAILGLVRKAVGETHAVMDRQPIPRSPVQGCRCPKCERSRQLGS